jgi:ribosome maturation factor RimP
MEVIEQVKLLIDKYLEQNSIELVEAMYRREQGGMMLRLLVDKAGGINIKDCEELNNFLSRALDEANVIEERYTIEVSSPGLDRPIKTDRDFEKSMGRAIDVTTYEPVDGSKTHSGVLIGMNKEEVVIASGDVSTVIPRSKVAMARLRIEI